MMNKKTQALAVYKYSPSLGPLTETKDQLLSLVVRFILLYMKQVLLSRVHWTMVLLVPVLNASEDL